MYLFSRSDRNGEKKKLKKHGQSNSLVIDY